jgi:NifB/MoaA-like Fe-S oxidoreductase
VRWLQQRIAAVSTRLKGWDGSRIGVLTGTAMSQLMPQVLAPLARITGSEYELIPVVNSLFGPRVTTAGLLPGVALQQALRGRGDLDLALLPSEAVNDEGLFIDGMSLELLEASVPVDVRLSKDFTDVLEIPAAA